MVLSDDNIPDKAESNTDADQSYKLIKILLDIWTGLKDKRIKKMFILTNINGIYK